jgi:RimJ/RimL family protein N-acetyltransferase
MIFFNATDLAKIVSREAGGYYNPDCDRSIVRTADDETILGGVIYQSYNTASIVMSVAGFTPNWLTRDLLWAAFDYPFNQLGCERVFSLINENNTKSLEFNRKLGFKEVTRIPGMFLDGAAIITAMEETDCRWHRIRPRGLRSNMTLAKA